MGAWGYKTFEDDTALDLVDEWVHADDAVSLMEAAIEEALAADYMEYTEGQAISVASALVEIAYNPDAPERQEGDDFVDGFGMWIDTVDKERLGQLAPRLINGIDALVGDSSELAELWVENELLYPRWRQTLLDRKEFLEGIAVVD